jgi:hypothetical protein
VAKPVKHRGKWRIRWVDERGKRRSAVFDDYRRAQTELSRRQVEAEEIKRGIRNAAPPEKTFNDLCDYWLEKRAPRKRSEKDDQSIIRKHLRPYFGTMRVQNIGVEDGDDYLNAKIDGEGLSDKCAEGESVFVLYALAIFTGMRAGEIAALEWSDVDLDRRLITVQRSFDGPTKSGKLRHVPILDPLLPVLRAWRLRHPGQLVFTNELGTMFKPSARIFQEVLHRVLDAAEFAKVQRNGKERPYVRFHDLRHSFASHWVMKGGDLFKLQKVLGHQSVQMTMRYAHLAPEAFAADYARLGTAIAVGEADVIELKRGSG